MHQCPRSERPWLTNPYPNRRIGKMTSVRPFTWLLLRQNLWNKLAGNFFEDVGHIPEGLTNDRRDNSKGYYPEKRWLRTMTQQARNKRNNVIVTYLGQSMCFSEAIERVGANRGTIWSRMKSWGCSFEEAIGESLSIQSNWSAECIHQKIEAFLEDIKAQALGENCTLAAFASVSLATRSLSGLKVLPWEESYLGHLH